jgi:hypothetical protein
MSKHRSLHDSYALSPVSMNDACRGGAARDSMTVSPVSPVSVSGLAGVTAWRDAYLESGAASHETRAAFLAIARERGLTVSQRAGLLMARDASGRVVGFLDTYPRDGTPDRPAPTTPCAGCGAQPAGTYHDGSPRYRCGPHPVTYAEETR